MISLAHSVSEQALNPFLFCMTVTRLESDGVRMKRKSSGMQAKKEGKQAVVQDVLAVILVSINIPAKINFFFLMGGVISFIKKP